jgi:hypothetical protein
MVCFLGKMKSETDRTEIVWKLPQRFQYWGNKLQIDPAN